MIRIHIHRKRISCNIDLIPINNTRSHSVRDFVSGSERLIVSCMKTPRTIFKMDSAPFVFLLLNVVIFAVNCASPTALSTNVCDDAIQKLETKVENLIALVKQVKKISAPKPPPPGIRVDQENTRVSVQTVQFGSVHLI